MISRRIFLSLISAAMLAVSILPESSRAQVNSTQGFDKLSAAFALNNAGHPAQAIAAAERLLASGTLSRTDQAYALDLEGMCYRDLDQPEKAVKVLEAAQALLRPADTRLQGSILDNLGGVYVSRGDRATAERLYERAFRLLEAASDHAEMVRVLNNQTGLALSEKKDRLARKYLERSEREAKVATDLTKDDLAAIASLHGWLSLNEGDTAGGVAAYRRSVELWTGIHGEQHPLTALGTFLLGQAEALNGQWQEASRTMEKGLALTKATGGDTTARYLAVEIAYAKLLDRMGETARAAALQQDARTKQAALQTGSCRNCVVSVVASH